jgi:hypothetical protein
MLGRVAALLLRSPALLLYVLLCLLLSASGFIGADLLMMLGLAALGDPLVVWLLAIFSVVWGLFWLYLVVAVLRGAMRDEA